MNENNTEPLDSGTHERYLDSINNTLSEIVLILKEIRKELQQLPGEIATEMR